MSTQEERISRELAEIHSRIPKILKQRVVRKVKLTPELEQVVDLALNDPDFPGWKKEELQKMRDRGDFSKEGYVEDREAAKAIDQFVDREIKKKQKSGKLPRKVNSIKGLKNFYEKIHREQNKGKDRA